MQLFNRMQRSWWIPYVFFTFFAVVASVNIYYIYISQKTWRGITTENSYQKGLRYNDFIKNAEEQKNLGWKLSTYYNNHGHQSGEILVHLEDKNGHLIEDAKVTAKFKRPTQEGHDFTQVLKFISSAYSSNISFPLKGVWDVEIEASTDNHIVQEVRRYVVQ